MNWEFYGGNKIFLFYLIHLKNYPTDCDKLHNSKLLPQMLASELLRKVCKDTHDKILQR